MTTAFASIPSPSSGALTIGPLSIHAYGLMIALGVIAAVWLLGRRLEVSGVGTREDASSIAVWAVIAGVIGSRLYHVVTDWELFRHDLIRIPQIWRGGLGIPGGILFGTLAAAWAFKRRGIAPAVGVGLAAPSLPLAQAIGRWGNWWNQELFGKPTTLPWALRIDADKIPAGYAPGTTFHPTFLYESLWNLALCVMLAADRSTIQASAGPAVRDLCGRLRHGPVLGRGLADRLRPHHRRIAPQPVGGVGGRAVGDCVPRDRPGPAPRLGHSRGTGAGVRARARSRRARSSGITGLSYGGGVNRASPHLARVRDRC